MARLVVVVVSLVIVSTLVAVVLIIAASRAACLLRGALLRVSGASVAASSYSESWSLSARVRERGMERQQSARRGSRDFGRAAELRSLGHAAAPPVPTLQH